MGIRLTNDMFQGSLGKDFLDLFSFLVCIELAKGRRVTVFPERDITIFENGKRHYLFADWSPKTDQHACRLIEYLKEFYPEVFL